MLMGVWSRTRRSPTARVNRVLRRPGFFRRRNAEPAMVAHLPAAQGLMLQSREQLDEYEKNYDDLEELGP